MNLIERIRQKPQAEKIRIIWLAIIAAVIILAALWVVSAKFAKPTSKDTTLFHTISQGVRDIRNNYKK